MERPLGPARQFLYALSLLTVHPPQASKRNTRIDRPDGSLSEQSNRPHRCPMPTAMFTAIVPYLFHPVKCDLACLVAKILGLSWHRHPIRETWLRSPSASSPSQKQRLTEATTMIARSLSSCDRKRQLCSQAKIAASFSAIARKSAGRQPFAGSPNEAVLIFCLRVRATTVLGFPAIEALNDAK